TGVFPLGTYTHVGVVGLLATVLTTVIVSLLTQPDYYAREGFEGATDMTNSFSDEEKRVLTYIHYGYDTMAEISDMLGVDSSVSNKIIEDLDQRHVIGRKKYSGPGFYTFHIREDIEPDAYLPEGSHRYAADRLTEND